MNDPSPDALPDPSPAPLNELAAQAQRTRVAVIGGGIAGLVAAVECAKIGIRVTLYEASDRLGGTVRTDLVAGLRVDTGAEFVTGPALAGLIAELGLPDRIAHPAVTTRWVAGLGDGTDAAPLPTDAILGIPENVWGEDVQRILGVGGTWRAYMDRLRPPLTIGHERSLARLVRTRMGPKALQRLVAPLTHGIYGVDPENIDVELASPGLSAALTRAGSLSGAVSVLRGQRPGQPATGLAGGLSALVDALAERLQSLGAHVHTGAAVTAVEPAGPSASDGWIVHTADGEFDATADGADGLEAVDAVIVAVPEREARRLLTGLVPDLLEEAAAPGEFAVETVTLVVDEPALDAAPRGAEIVTVPGSRSSTGASQLSARWEWLAERAAASSAAASSTAAITTGRHVVRVAFGSAAAPPVTADLDDAAAAELARDEASVLFGVSLPKPVAAVRERFTASPPHALMDRAAHMVRVRTAVEAVHGLAVVGGWVAGSGIAQVVPDAIEAAARVRGAVLFARGSGA